MKTQAALCAKQIKKELSHRFPNIKFTVKSENFAGGDAVHIRYENGVPSENVDKIVGKYQYGHFDGMIDLYEYSNVNPELHQVKYVQVERTISPENLKAIKEKIMKDFGMKNDGEQEWMKKFHFWSDQVIWREARNLTFNQ